MTVGSMRPRRALWVVAGLYLAASAALAACSSGDGSTSLATVPSTPSTASGQAGTATTSPTSSGSAGSGAPTIGATSKNPSTSSAGYRPPNLTPEQLAVAKAYQSFWNYRAAAFGNAAVDPAEASKYAEAGAILDMQRYTAQQRQKDTHTVGASTTNLLSVVVDGGRATVKDCFDDRSADVSDSTGKAVETPLGRTEFTAQLVRSGGTWKVSKVGQTGPACTVSST